MQRLSSKEFWGCAGCRAFGVHLVSVSQLKGLKQKVSAAAAGGRCNDAFFQDGWVLKGSTLPSILCGMCYVLGAIEEKIHQKCMVYYFRDIRPKVFLFFRTQIGRVFAVEAEMKSWSGPSLRETNMMNDSLGRTLDTNFLGLKKTIYMQMFLCFIHMI